MKVTALLGSMRMNALGGRIFAAAAASAWRCPTGKPKLSSKPPPAGTPALRKCRRERSRSKRCGSRTFSSFGVVGARPMENLPSARGKILCSLLDGGADARIGPTAADIAGHGTVDVGISGMRVAGQQCGGRHDLTGLAIAALHDLRLEPRLLDRFPAWRIADCFDRRDRGCTDTVDGGDA